MMRVLAVLLTIALAGCRDDSAPPVPQPGASGWSWTEHSKGMRPPALEGEWVTFRFDGGEPHMLLRRVTAPISGSAHLTWKCEGCQVQPSIVSMIITRRGNTWSGDQPNHRWYWWGQQISPGGSVVVPLESSQWRNVVGHQVPSEFVATLGEAIEIGVCFGDPGAGATCHGVRGVGKFSFILDLK